MKLGLATLVGMLILLLAAAGGGASATQQAGKPALLPGAWVGKGRITTAIANDPAYSRFSGRIAFTLVVDNKLHVSGVGKWRLTTLEADDAEYRGGAVKGWAAMQFAGTSAAVRLSGTEYVIGELTDPAVRRPIRFEQKLDGVLPITRVGRCTASGSALVQRGVIMSWSAQLKRCSV